MPRTSPRHRALIALTLVAILGLVAASPPQASAATESEPNNTIAQASPIAAGIGNAVTDATIAPLNEDDYFRFEAEAGRTYAIETFNIQATNDGHATGLFLYNSTGTQLADDQYGQNGTYNVDARIVYTFTQAGSYYIRVKDRTFSDWTGTYSLRVLPRWDEGGGPDPAADFEPNDWMGAAVEIQAGFRNARTHQLAPHRQFVTNNSDHDYFRFQAEAGRTYVIETFNIQATGDGHATGLFLYNSTGTQLADDEYGANGLYNADARITYTFTQAGTYYLLVKDRTFSEWTGTYSLRILPRWDEGGEWDPAADFEPNDSMALALPLELGVNQARTHQLAPHTQFVTNSSDHDYFRLQAQAGVTYVIETTGVPNDATALFLYNSTGTLLADDEYGGGGSGNVDARIRYTFTTDGVAYVLVKDRTFREWTGTYNLRACVGSCLSRVHLPLVRR